MHHMTEYFVKLKFMHEVVATPQLLNFACGARSSLNPALPAFLHSTGHSLQAPLWTHLPYNA
jgi:hypothetical protein